MSIKCLLLLEPDLTRQTFGESATERLSTWYRPLYAPCVLEFSILGRLQVTREGVVAEITAPPVVSQ